MLLFRGLVVAVLTVCGAGYLRIPLLHDVSHHAAIYQTEHIPKGGQQRVLSSSPSTHHQLPTFKAGQYNLRKQDNTTCATYGESQWTGTIDVTDTHRLFFWFFESRNDPVDDPIVIWINGGPGASSMLGLFNEIGPCSYESDANETTPNPWAWNRNASLLFIDQPAGVGFSSVAEGGRLPATDIDGAEDFQVFLNIFFQKVFPDKAHLPIYFTGESYGGHYAPVYTRHILESRAYNSKTAFWGNITSLVLVNALLDFTAPAIGVYELLCHQSRGQGILNVTACDGIRQNLPETERLGRVCDLSYDGHECLAMMTHFMNNINNYYYKLVQSGERSPYNIHVGCPNPLICDDPRKGNFTEYLNRETFKESLGFTSSFTYSPLQFELNMGYWRNGMLYQPTTKELRDVLEAHERTQLGDIRVLVLNGNEDYTINTPGQKWLYDNLLWSQQADFRVAQWSDLPKGVSAKGSWKGTRDGRLVFVSVDGAGHTAPGDVPEGAYKILQKWIEGGWRA